MHRHEFAGLVTVILRHTLEWFYNKISGHWTRDPKSGPGARRDRCAVRWVVARSL